jgi:hypothetical protein
VLITDVRNIAGMRENSDSNLPAASSATSGAIDEDEARQGPLQQILSYIKFYAEQCGYAKQELSSGSM